MIDGKPKVLYLLNSITETSMPYNELIIPNIAKYDIYVCSFLEIEHTKNENIRYIEGNGSIYCYFKLMWKCVRNDGYDLIHVHSCLTAMIFIAAGALRNISVFGRTVMTVHSSWNVFRFHHKIVLVACMGMFRKMICCGGESHKSLPTTLRKIFHEKLCVIPNGLNIERIEKVVHGSCSEEERKNIGFTFIYVAAFKPIKNHQVLLSAFGKLPLSNVRLCLVGDGNLLEECRACAEKMTFKGEIEFTGMVSREAVFELLLQADAFISPSLGEGLPVSVLEAMACGCPVILSDIPSHREIGAGLECIPFVQPTDADGFMAAMERFVEASWEDPKAWGKQCRDHVLKNYSLERMLKEYDQIYIEIWRDSPY